ncbi:MAG: thioesterase family protein [Actinomycetota bacterium]|nr:thioesterase family protein [Actinomycetota bacterium]
MPASAPNQYPEALFLPATDGVEATDLSRGPWSHGVMHGGPICGLLARTIENRLDREDLVCSRLTVEILSGVPVGLLETSSELIKNGKRTAVVEASISRNGQLLARATSQWLSSPERLQSNGASTAEIPPQRADPGAHPDMNYPRPGFNADAVELRVIRGSTEESGPGLIWARLDHPLVAGESPSRFQQAATLCDLGAAVGWEHSDDDQPFINTDVTLQLLRSPESEWILFDSAVHRVSSNLACCNTTLMDQSGLLGWVMQSQMVAPDSIQF